MEETNIAESKQKQDLSFEDIKTLTEVGVIPKDCPPELVKLYGKICAETQLNPFRKQIHFIRRGTSYIIQIGIDGYRSIADRTGLYAGSDDYIFDDEKNPSKATVTVYKLVNGIRCPFTASARMSEYKPKDEKMAFMWNKMPNLMLGKCSESLALRKAFPNELSGTYTDEEMHQADVIDVSPKKAGGGSATPIADKVAGPKPANYSKEIICSKCEVPIKSNVADHSLSEFGKMLCWDHQQEEREFKKAGNHHEQQELNDIDEVVI